MHHAHNGLAFRAAAMGSVSLRLVCSLCLTLAVSGWTSIEAWALSVNPTAVTFQAVQGATNPPGQTVTVSRSNKRSSSWTAMDNAAWLTASAGSAIITKTGKVALAVNTAGLAAGTYTATVTIRIGKGGSTSIPVTLKVAPGTTSGTSPGGSGTSTGTVASLTWGAVTDTSLAGYKVYMGTSSGRYGTPLDVGNITSYKASNLTLGTTYYFVVTSYNSSGSESPYSNEVSKSIY